MVLFWPIQQELDCITDSGEILGKIRFDATSEKHIFTPADAGIVLSAEDKAGIEARLAGLDAGQFSIPMQDDD